MKAKKLAKTRAKIASKQTGRHDASPSCPAASTALPQSTHEVPMTDRDPSTTPPVRTVNRVAPANAPRILVACEFSGVVRRAFRAIGFDAWSCDLLPAEDGDKHHIQDHVENHLEDGWHGMIAHPPCTRLTVAGARWFKGREQEQAQAIRFVEDLWFAPIPRIAIENPIGVLSTRSRLGKPTQIVQPWMFGHGETKATCFWLKRLPELIPTDIVAGREARVHKMPPGPNRWKDRSRTYQGIADAMAAQWAESFAEQARRVA